MRRMVSRGNVFRVRLGYVLGIGMINTAIAFLVGMLLFITSVRKRSIMRAILQCSWLGAISAQGGLV